MGQLVGAAYTRSVRISGTGRGGKEREEVLEIRSLNNAAGKRASKARLQAPTVSGEPVMPVACLL